MSLNCAEVGATVTTELAEDCVLETDEDDAEEVGPMLLVDELPPLRDEDDVADEALEVSELADSALEEDELAEAELTDSEPVDAELAEEELAEEELVEAELVDALLATFAVLEALETCDASESLIAFTRDEGTQVVSKLEYPGKARPKT